MKMQNTEFERIKRIKGTDNRKTSQIIPRKQHGIIRRKKTLASKEIEKIDQ